MADAYQLETTVDRYLLEDGTGVLLIDETTLYPLAYARLAQTQALMGR